jgi:hypothetical protein
MADLRSTTIRRAHTVFEAGRRIGRLIVASVRLGWHAELGSTVTGLTLTTSTRQAETILYGVDLTPRPVLAMAEIETEAGWELVDLDPPDSVNGALDG